ncbi:hypothetical protein HaLaN_25920, partial [Haematococcus lacustris]
MLQVEQRFSGQLLQLSQAVDRLQAELHDSRQREWSMLLYGCALSGLLVAVVLQRTQGCGGLLPSLLLLLSLVNGGLGLVLNSPSLQHSASALLLSWAPQIRLPA